MTSTWIYPGTFDPVTLGHRDIILRASKLCLNLIVAVTANQSKQTQFSQNDRIELLKLALAGIDNVQILPMDGLIIDFAKAQNANIVVRGLRSGEDLAFEQQLHAMNQAMKPDFETVFLATNPRYSHISSSIVREIVKLGGDVSPFVPESVLPKLK